MLLPLDSRWTDTVWQSPYRLRFQLNTGGKYINMFTSAYDRARQLARAALALERPMGVLVEFVGLPCPESADDELPGSTGFEILQDMGVPSDAPLASWAGNYRPYQLGDEEGSQLCEFRALELTWDQADILLWSNIAQDIGVRPRAPVYSRLADPERGIVVYAYDDRGMDVTALSAEPIEHLYRTFDTWILDHDRPRMIEVFGR